MDRYNYSFSIAYLAIQKAREMMSRIIRASKNHPPNGTNKGNPNSEIIHNIKIIEAIIWNGRGRMLIIQRIKRKIRISHNVIVCPYMIRSDELGIYGSRTYPAIQSKIRIISKKRITI